MNLIKIIFLKKMTIIFLLKLIEEIKDYLLKILKNLNLNEYKIKKIMPLQKINFKPGFNKQQTATGAEGQWIDGNNVRFRYGQAEKIGGWEQLVASQIAGPVRDQHTWTDLNGKKYAALGTSKVLVIYYEGGFYDITPINADQTGCTFDSTTGDDEVTVNLTAHGLIVGDYFKFKSVTLPGGGVTGYTTADFQTNVFEVISQPTANTFTITMPSNESGSGMSAQGSATLNSYITIGPVFQTPAFGWGVDIWGSEVGGEGWGEEADVTNVTLDPGSWSLDNYGQLLVATVRNGATFTWNPDVAGALDTRAVIVADAPTKSLLSLVSDRDRHLFLMGTLDDLADSTSQNKMFIRFSDQEDINVWNPTATNTAGTFLLDQGNEIITAVQGKDYVLVLTDQAAYVIQFVGPPFTFSLRQVGSNCGCLGQHAAVYAQGAVFWMGFGGGFFMYDGTVKQLPSLVEDFVFTTQGGDPGINYEANQIAYAYHNSLYNEVGWFYASNNSQQINRTVIYNFMEQSWTTGNLARTSYNDAHTYDTPYATEFYRTDVPTFPVINGATNTFGASKYWAHEVGVNEVDANGNATAIPSYIQSGDYDLSEQGLAGDGEFIMRVSRFIPDFKNLDGNAKITLFFRDYPAETEQSDSNGPLITGPFTITTTTNFVSTRVRGRQVSIKIENDAVDESWRYGTLRLDIHAGGRR
jgi:hypothetical protein